MQKYFATVHLLINADSDGEAADAVSALLSENGIYSDDPALMDWEYTRKGDHFNAPRAVDVPEDYDRNDDALYLLNA